MEVAEWTHITMLDRQYPPEKQAEGLAVSQAVVQGHCLTCGFYRECTANSQFQFPVFAWCSRRKAEILTEWNMAAQREEGWDAKSAPSAAREAITQ